MSDDKKKTFEELVADLPDDLGTSMLAVSTVDGVVVCNICLSTKPCPPEQSALYMRKGWPRCCEETMELVKLST